MNQQQVREIVVREIRRQTGLENFVPVTDDQRLAVELDFDDLDTIELVMELEKSELEITIDDAQVDELVTVGDVVRVCGTCLGERLET